MIVKTIPDFDRPNDVWIVYFKHLGSSANIAVLQDRRDVAFLYDMYSTNPRKGEGAALLREIDEYCLSRQIMLVVKAEPYGTRQGRIVFSEDLKNWYAKNGAYFVEYDEYGTPTLLLGTYPGR